MTAATKQEARIVVAIKHAAFAPERKRTLTRLLSRLAEVAASLPVVVAYDTDKKGST